MNNNRIALFLACTLALLSSCGGGGKSSTTVIPTGNEAPVITENVVEDTTNPADPELIQARVETIYEAVANAYPEIRDITPSTDSLELAYCSNAWRALVEMVNSKDAESMGGIGFFDADFWIMGQDWDKISASNIKAEIKDDRHAEVTLDLHNFSDIKVKLEMVFEQGEWMIDNFIDQTHDVNWKENMVKYLEEAAAKDEEKKKDDGIIEYEQQ